jgi:hypothetical protein
VRVLRSRLDQADARLEQAERHAQEHHSHSLHLDHTNKQLTAKLTEAGDELERCRHQLAVNKRQHRSALRRAEGMVERVKGQLEEAVREGVVGKADAMFSRLPVSTVDGDDDSVGGGGARAEALNRENGELRALLASVHVRLCGGSTSASGRGLYELPVSLFIEQVGEDIESVLEGFGHNNSSSSSNK